MRLAPRQLLRRPEGDPTTVKTILIVDDSEIVRAICADWIGVLGHRVVVSDGAAEFARLIATEKPDLVLMDVDMPGLSGVKLSSLARRDLLLSCPIVLHSARPVGELDVLARSQGLAGFIKKTDDRRFFQKRISDVLMGWTLS